MEKYRFLAIASVFLLICGSIIGILVPAGTGWDFANFYGAGKRMVAGETKDLYQGRPGFYGTPLSGYFYLPLGYFSPQNALLFFKIQNTVACFAALIILYLYYRKFVGDTPAEQSKFAGLFAFVTLIYQPFWAIYRIGGQTTPTVFLLVTLALVFHTAKRFLLSSLFLVAATIIKPIFVIALLFLLIVSPLPFLAYTVSIFSIIGIASVLLLGWSIHLKFLSQMLNGLKDIYPWFYNSSLYVPLENLKVLSNPPLSPGAQKFLLVLQNSMKAVIVLTMGVLTWKGLRQQWQKKAALHFTFMMAVLLFLFLSQTVWEHYLAFFFLFLGYVIALHRHFSKTSQLMFAGIFALCLAQNMIVVIFLREHFLFDTAPELLLIGLLKSAPLYLMLIFLWTRSRELFHSYTTPEWSR